MANVRTLIGVVLFLFIGLALFPSIQNFVTTAKVNASSSVDGILDIVPIIYVIGIISASVAALIIGGKGV